MERPVEREDALVDLGVASVETKGAVNGKADEYNQPRQILGGISDD